MSNQIVQAVEELIAALMMASRPENTSVYHPVTLSGPPPDDEPIREPMSERGYVVGKAFAVVKNLLPPLSGGSIERLRDLAGSLEQRWEAVQCDGRLFHWNTADFVALRRAAEACVIPGPSENRLPAVEPPGNGCSRIPLKRQTRPMSLREAGRLMGYKGSPKNVAKRVRRMIDDGSIRVMEENRQTFIFDTKDFPDVNYKKVRAM